MGCSPSTPADMGKNKTTKDLESIIEKVIYIINSSFQMGNKNK
jgi:hypothetical protein